MKRLESALDGIDVFKAMAAFWAVFVALNTARSLLLGYANPGGAFERRLVVAAVGALLSWAMYRVVTLVRPRTLGRSIALTSFLSLPAGLAFSTVNFLIFDMFAPLPGEACEHGLPCTMHDLVVSVSDMLINWSFVFAAWGLLHLSLVSAAQTRVADLRSATDREAARLAEIRALRYQVNPHFLFNVLNSLSALVSRRETEDAERLIGEIGRFFRHGLATDAVADTSLADEVDLQRRYLKLERRRFPERMSISIDVGEDVAEAAVPPLILQPLVENAIKHGVGRTSKPVTVFLWATRGADGSLLVVVEDDAPTQPATSIPAGSAGGPDGFGIGLRNVAERLRARFGDDATVTAGARPEGGYRVELSMPCVRLGST